MGPPKLNDLTHVHRAAAALATRPPTAPRAQGLTHCEADGLPLKTHLKCAACGILIGPYHYREHLIDGLCAPCHRREASGLDVRRRRLGGCAKAG